MNSRTRVPSRSEWEEERKDLTHDRARLLLKLGLDSAQRKHRCALFDRSCLYVLQVTVNVKFNVLH
jgi:hypothetical protein